MGNGVSYDVLGVGCVKFICENGSKFMLTNVMYVPHLKRNLISLGYLDGKGLVFSAQGGVLNIVKNDKCLLSGKLYNGLYHLNGSAFVDSNVRFSMPTVVDNLPANVFVNELDQGSIVKDYLNYKSCAKIDTDFTVNTSTESNVLSKVVSNRNVINATDKSVACSKTESLYSYAQFNPAFIKVELHDLNKNVISSVFHLNPDVDKGQLGDVNYDFKK